jgi:hypothetical protein
VKDIALSSQLQRSETDVAYAPQLGEALHITHTQLNVIGELLPTLSMLIFIFMQASLEIVRLLPDGARSLANIVHSGRLSYIPARREARRS